MKSVKTKIDNLDLKPFAYATSLWVLFGTVGVGVFSSSPIKSMSWFLVTSILAVLDFFAIVGLVLALIRSDDQKGSAVLWVFGKIICLGAFGLVLWLGKASVQALPVLLGASTLVAVPFLGGIFSQKLIGSDPITRH